jgi:hypothetical protein
VDYYNGTEEDLRSKYGDKEEEDVILFEVITESGYAPEIRHEMVDEKLTRWAFVKTKE